MRKSLIELFATHRVAANLLMAIMLISGIWSLARINTQFLPNFKLNIITVNIAWPGANAQDVETAITHPLEERLHNIDHLKKITSKSYYGGSRIVLEFKSSTNISEALDRVKQSVSELRSLPESSDAPEIKRLLQYEEIARLIIAGSKHIAELRPLVHKFKQQLLDEGIPKVTILGIPKQEIAIQVSAQTISALNISLPQIAAAIDSHSQDIPAGSIGENDITQEVRGLNQKRSVIGFLELPVLHNAGGHLIRLGNIAKIEKRSIDKLHVTYKGQPAVELILYRTETASALGAANILHHWLSTVTPTLPKGIVVIPYFESWKLIKERINLLLKNAVWGLGLILIILFLFLNIRIAIWVAIGIPASFLAAIAVSYLFGGTINMVSLFAMIMTLGIIVDDSIVVGEEVLSQLHNNVPIHQAVKEGAQSMLAPIIASSLTTIVAFLPLMLIGGVIGQILFDIPFVAICIIIASLVECFLVLPGHLYQSCQKPSKHRPPLDSRFNKFRENIFRPLLIKTLRKSWLCISISISVAIITIATLMSGHMKFNFFPTPEGSRIQADIQFVSGTSAKTVKNFISYLENTLEKTDKQLSKNGDSILIAYSSLLNKSITSRRGENKVGKQYASMNIELSSPENRKLSNQQFIDAWRKNIILPTGMSNFNISAPRTGPPGKDIHIELSGKNTYKLKEAAVHLTETLKGIPGTSNVSDNLPFGKNHIIFNLSPQGHALNLTTQDIGRQLSAAFNGLTVQFYHEPNEEIQVRVILPDEERKRSNILENFPIVTPDHTTVPLGSIATFENQHGFEALNHTNTKLTVKVTADVNGAVTTPNNVLALLKKDTLPKISQKYSVSANISGRAEEQSETFHDMIYGLLLALVLIYIILSWVFSSYGWPLLIMLAIPIGLAGAIWGHVIMHMSLTILSLFGFFGLSGIVINDSIILVNRYRKLKESGMQFRKAIIEATCQRLRPVILTSTTTIAGLSPLLFETSLQAQFLIPMAVSIVFGLLFSTILILLLIPSLLYLYEKRHHRDAIT